jgi:hypothetical protein
MQLDVVVKWLKALLPAFLILVACAALFLGIAGMGEWSAACGSILGLWFASKGYGALKAKRAEK